jgi:hypothetical protein
MTRWRWVLNFTPQLLYSLWRVSIIYYIWGWVVFRADLNAVGKRDISCLVRESKKEYFYWRERPRK